MKSVKSALLGLALLGVAASAHGAETSSSSR